GVQDVEEALRHEKAWTPCRNSVSRIACAAAWVNFRRCTCCLWRWHTPAASESTGPRPFHVSTLPRRPALRPSHLDGRRDGNGDPPRRCGGGRVPRTLEPGA